MEEKERCRRAVAVLVTMIAVLTAVVIYLMYQNFLAEDMLKDMDRDYEELCGTDDGAAKRRCDRRERQH